MRNCLLAAILILSTSHAVRADYQWIDAKGDEVPAGAFPAGREVDGTALYICRAFHEGGLHPGKFRPGLGGCHIAFGNTAVIIANHQTIVNR